MGKSIRYVDYDVVRNGEVIHSGSVPAIIAVGGSNKDYDLAGLWLSHNSDEATEIHFTGTDIDAVVFSSSRKTDWLKYIGEL